MEEGKLTITCIISPMGGGKTLFSTLIAKIYSVKYPDREIYANYRLNLPNAIFTPNLFMPLSKIGNCLIIADDFYALKNIDAFIGIIVNLSRKKEIEVIITVQYYTMIQKQIRTLSNYLASVRYYPDSDILTATVINQNNQQKMIMCKNAVSIAKKIYDTNEVVKFYTENQAKKEILKVCSSPDDLDLNLSLYFRNAATRRRLYKELITKI